VVGGVGPRSDNHAGPGLVQKRDIGSGLLDSNEWAGETFSIGSSEVFELNSFAGKDTHRTPLALIDKTMAEADRSLRRDPHRVLPVSARWSSEQARATPRRRNDIGGVIQHAETSLGPFRL
jgi:hypothetical protein